MNKFKCVFVIVLVVATAFALNSCSKESSNWAAKIGNDYITFDELDSQMKLQAKMSMLSKEETDNLLKDIKRKKAMLEQLIQVKAVYKKAMEDKSLNKEELNQIVELSKMQAITNFYVMEKLKNEIVVSDKEVEEIYNRSPNIPKGMPRDQAFARIKAELFMQKLSQKSRDYVMNLVGDSSVNREGFRKYEADAEKKEAENKGTQNEQKK
ncbi:MAG TPA: SurA N-terminal domain-containing protein [Syntrophales bacterium]|nr:SurA N-terminal domain-containing protein [Syntrophales bacterium]